MRVEEYQKAVEEIIHGEGKNFTWMSVKYEAAFGLTAEIAEVIDASSVFINAASNPVLQRVDESKLDATHLLTLESMRAEAVESFNTCRENLILELGDVCFFVAMMASAIDVRLSNMKKAKVKYSPDESDYFAALIMFNASISAQFQHRFVGEEVSKEVIEVSIGAIFDLVTRIGKLHDMRATEIFEANLRKLEARNEDKNDSGSPQ